MKAILTATIFLTTVSFVHAGAKEDAEAAYASALAKYNAAVASVNTCNQQKEFIDALSISINALYNQKKGNIVTSALAWGQNRGVARAAARV